MREGAEGTRREPELNGLQKYFSISIHIVPCRQPGSVSR